MSDIIDILQSVAKQFQRETGTSGFCRITLTDEVYDKMMSEISAVIRSPISSKGKLFLSDRYVQVERETPYPTVQEPKDE